LSGRQHEIQAAIALLDYDPAANPLLVGEPGVGVTTVARGIAQEIVREPRGKQIHQLDPARLAGTHRLPIAALRKLLLPSSGAPDVVVIIEHARSLIHTADGSSAAIDLVRPMVLSDELRVIATATPAGQREWSAADGQLYARFQPIVIDELSEAVSAQALSELRYRYEAKHRVAIPDAAINAAVTLAARHITNTPLPGPAIELMDHAATLAAYRIPSGQSRELADLRSRKDAAIDARDFATAGRLRELEKELLAREVARRAEWKNTPDHPIVSVTIADVEQALAARPAA
jgi:ATP-dependent Clp protease ATP-binding subunit ClpC